MTYKTIAEIKITSNPNEDESMLLGEIVKNEILSNQVKELAKSRYLELLEELLEINREFIEVEISFVEDSPCD